MTALDTLELLCRAVLIDRNIVFENIKSPQIYKVYKNEAHFCRTVKYLIKQQIEWN